jgi:hypothetical protein
VRLKNITGQVDVQPGEDGVVAITATKHVATGDARRTRIELTQAPDGEVQAETRYSSGPRFWLWGFGWREEPCRVDYTVRVPRQCALKVENVDGQVSVQGLAGEFEVLTVSSALQMSNLEGRLSIDNVSGAVTGENLRLAEALRLKTVSGDVVFTESHIPALAAVSVSGHVQLHTPLGAGPYQLNSVSGDLFLHVPAGTAAHLGLRTVSGSVVTSNLPAATRRLLSEGYKSVDVGQGGPDVSVKGVSGNLVLLAPEPPVTEPEAAPAPAPAPTRLDILERIARGELSVDEAVAALEAS